MTTENKLVDFLTYFRTLAMEHVEIKDFVHGPSADIIGRSRSDLQYPCLWLETPTSVIKDNGARHVVVDRLGAFVILENLQGGTKAERDALWEKLERITFQVLARMRRDKLDRKFDFNTASLTVEPISALFVDDDYGWRVEFDQQRQTAFCVDPDQWQEGIFDPTFDPSYE